MDPHNYSKQIETSELILDLQITILYLLRMIISMIQRSLKRTILVILKNFNRWYSNSLLNLLIFKLKTYLLIRQSQQNDLMKWLRNKLPESMAPKNFNIDWRNGIRLCTLCEIVRPGCCPRYDLLDANDHFNNLNLALCLLQNNLRIKIDLNANEIYECQNETKLIHLLNDIMKLVHSKQISSNDRGHHNDEDNYIELHENYFNNCQIKGMGIRLGVQSRRTKFSILYPTYNNDNVENISKTIKSLSLFIEIIGPYQSYCLENIQLSTNNSGNNNDNPHEYYRSIENVQYLSMKAAIKLKSMKVHNLKIPLFYEISNSNHNQNQLLVTYIPLFQGEHRINIVWQGRFIFHSPYFVEIEDTEYLQYVTSSAIKNEMIGPKFTPGMQYPLCLLNTDDNKRFNLNDIGTIVRRKVLRKSIIIKEREYDYYNYLERLKRFDKIMKSFSAATTSTIGSYSNENKDIANVHTYDELSKSLSFQSYDEESSDKSAKEQSSEEIVVEQSDGNQQQQQQNLTKPMKMKRNFLLKKVRPQLNAITENDQSNDGNNSQKKFSKIFKRKLIKFNKKKI